MERATLALTVFAEAPLIRRGATFSREGEEWSGVTVYISEPLLFLSHSGSGSVHLMRIVALNTPPSFPPHKGEGGACLGVMVPSSPSPLWGGIKGGGAKRTK